MFQPSQRRSGLLALVRSMTRLAWLLAVVLGCGSRDPGMEQTSPADLEAGDMHPGETEDRAQAPELSCRLALVGPAVAGEPILLRFELTNSSDRTVHVLKWYTPLEGLRGNLFRVTRDGKELDYRGPMVKRGQPQLGDYAAIPSGESVSAEVDLARAYDLSAPGEYQLAFRSRLRDFTWDEKELPKPVDTHVGLDLACNAIALQVVRR